MERKKCKYCNNEFNESIFYDKNSEGIREVVVEQDGCLSIFSNDYDRKEMEKSMAIGFSARESALMAEYMLSVKIKYCPMCGKRLTSKAQKKIKSI